MAIDIVADCRKFVTEAEAVKKVLAKIDDADARIILIEREKKEYENELAKIRGIVKEIEVPVPAPVKEQIKEPEKEQSTPSKTCPQDGTYKNKSADTEKYGLTIEKVKEVYINRRVGILQAAEELGVQASELDMYCRRNKLVKKYGKNFVSKDDSVDNSSAGNYKKCKVCGSKFYVPSAEDWAYKTTRHGGKIDYFCSWACLRKDENDKDVSGRNS